MQTKKCQMCGDDEVPLFDRPLYGELCELCSRTIDLGLAAYREEHRLSPIVSPIAFIGGIVFAMALAMLAGWGMFLVADAVEGLLR